MNHNDLENNIYYLFIILGSAALASLLTGIFEAIYFSVSGKFFNDKDDE